MRWLMAVVVFAAAVAGIFTAACTRTQPNSVSFATPSVETEAFDIFEIVAHVSRPRPANPFTESVLAGWFETMDGSRRWYVDGFADSVDGSVFRIRFMPSASGDYRYQVEYSQSDYHQSATGSFHAVDGHRRGPIRVDPQFRWHFVWEGTREHYLFNGTTAYWLLGWTDENVIFSSIERLHRLKINRIRVTLAGRPDRFFGDPVMPGDAWDPYMAAWPALQPQDIYHPGFDFSRFNVAHWQKFERMLRFARDRDVIISVVLDMNDGHVHPRAGSVEELRFIRYAVARLAAFSNVTWDLGDDLDLYRSVPWTRTTGMTLKSWDPYDHLATSHPVDNMHQDRGAEWFDFTSFQNWSRNQHAFMLAQRSQQLEFKRIIPQVNEEYGYEDHYPLWAPKPDGDSAEVLRRVAWDIAMAGGYGTTGETARRGTHVWPDTGGGWFNGRGDGTMTMLEGYGRMIDFFTRFEWWRTDPHDELVSRGNYCLALPGEIYALYLPHGGQATVTIQPANYTVVGFDAGSGVWSEWPMAFGRSWTSPRVPADKDWAFLLRRGAR
jgi:hypothetical protein